LGLAISQRIVKAHHGSLVVSGPAQGGAEFAISLPCIELEPPRPEAPSPPPEPRRTRKRRLPT
jgi:K+-sensing histidine kinase KdpD